MAREIGSREQKGRRVLYRLVPVARCSPIHTGALRAVAAVLHSRSLMIGTRITRVGRPHLVQ